MNEDLISRQVGDYEVSDRGIERVLSIGDNGCYITDTIIPKEVFIEAYQKWILESGADMRKEVK